MNARLKKKNIEKMSSQNDTYTPIAAAPAKMRNSYSTASVNTSTITICLSRKE